MASKATALHHQYGREPNRLTVLKKNGNRTCDLGADDGTLIVSGCPIGKQESPHRSYCIIEDEAGGKPPTKAELKKNAADLRIKADAAIAAAKTAMQAADAGKDSDKAEELVAAALVADEEAKAAVKAAEEAETAAK